jgi:hypothetical protein
MGGGLTVEAIRDAVKQLQELVAREGDEREFEDSGYHCIVHRDRGAGYWSGFVGIPDTHPYHGIAYDDVEEIDIHGGLEFSGPQIESGHGRPGLWYFGFDCDHFDDVTPKELSSLDPVSLSLKRTASYKRVEFVEQEVRKLAGQLRAAGHKRIYR